MIGAVLSDSVKYVQEVPSLNLRREINFYAYMKGEIYCVHLLSPLVLFFIPPSHSYRLSLQWMSTVV